MYRDTLIGGSANGCDTIVHLDLSVLAVQPTEVIGSICAGGGYAVFDQEYTEAGMYWDTLVGGAVNGCDTIVHLDLSLLVVQATEVIASICAGGIYAVFDQEYTEAGMYQDTLVGGAVNGCDTIVYLDLSVLAVQSTEVNASICAGGSYMVFDQEYTETGMYRDTLIGGSANGCDTIVHLDLSVLAVQPTEVNASICPGGSYTVFDQEYTEAGVYQATLDSGSILGCDSIVILDLKIEPQVEVVIFDTICIGSNVEKHRESGTYIDVFTTETGCDSVRILHLMVNNIYIPNAFSPNDDGINDNFSIHGTPGQNLQLQLVRIFDRWGDMVYEKAIQEELSIDTKIWDGSFNGKVLPPGVYIYIVRYKCNGEEGSLSGGVNLVK